MAQTGRPVTTRDGLHAEDGSWCLVLDLKAARLAQDLRLQDVAERLGVSTQYVHLLEKGKSCSVDTLSRWAKAVGRTVELGR